MPWKIIIFLLMVLIYVLFWFLIEPYVFSKHKNLRPHRFYFGVLVTIIFISCALLLTEIPVWGILIFSGLVFAALIVSLSLNTLKKKDDVEGPVDLKERDIIEWRGEIYEVRKIDKGFVRAIYQSGEILIPLKALVNEGYKKLRKVLPRKISFSIFFGVDFYLPFSKKMEEFLRQSPYVLSSPTYSLEFGSLAINEVELRITFYTESLRTENEFWSEFLEFIEREKLSINRLVRHGESKTDWW